jgi:hypothetical protein
MGQLSFGPNFREGDLNAPFNLRDFNGCVGDDFERFRFDYFAFNWLRIFGVGQIVANIDFNIDHGLVLRRLRSSASSRANTSAVSRLSISVCIARCDGLSLYCGFFRWSFDVSKSRVDRSAIAGAGIGLSVPS